MCDRDFHHAHFNAMVFEGGYSNNSNDKGGATKFGISLRFLKLLPELCGDINNDGHVDIEDIQVMTESDSKAFYKTYFWDHYNLRRIDNKQLSSKAFNLFINMRGQTAALVIQRACNDLSLTTIKEDGIIGSRTFGLINSLTPELLIACIKVRAWQVYKSIIESDPSQHAFMNGWRSRAFADR